MKLTKDRKVVRAVTLAALAGTVCWGLIFIGVGMFYAWCSIAMWFLSIVTMVAFLLGAASVIDALSEPDDDDDDDDDEHKTNYI